MSNKKLTVIDFAFEKLANQGLLVSKDIKNLVVYREAKEKEETEMCKFAFFHSNRMKNALQSDNEFYVKQSLNLYKNL